MLACFLLGSAVAYNLVMVVYRLQFHPLNKFPGPRLAAATGLYEIYFSIWGTEMFEYEIDQMHEKYGKHAHDKWRNLRHISPSLGPVVRITPDEVHVQEPTGTRYVDRWVKGTREESRTRTPYVFQFKRRSISRVRSILRMEFNQIISGLVEKHQVHRVVSTKLRPLIRDRIRTGRESDLEDGDHGYQLPSHKPQPTDVKA